MEVEEAAKAGDVVMMLVPDELCADIYNIQRDDRSAGLSGRRNIQWH